MKITPSRRTDYGLQAMIYLASATQARTGAPEIAERMSLSVHFLRQVLRDLGRAKLVLSSPSPTGGYALARPPERISVLEIVEALEGPLTPSECALRGGPCHWEDVCPLHPVWSGALEALTERLAAGSLASVAADDQALAEGRFTVPQDAHRRRQRLGSTGAAATEQAERAPTDQAEPE